MHRLFTVAILTILTFLTAASAQAGDAEITLKLATVGRSVTAIQWKPGLVSTNVRVKLRGLGRSSSRAATSGGKGGTEDINIGVGELQECTISKSMDSASPMLARLARTHRRLPRVILIGRDARGRALRVTLKNVMITSYRPSRTKGGGVRTETATITFTGLE